MDAAFVCEMSASSLSLVGAIQCPWDQIIRLPDLIFSTPHFARVIDGLGQELCVFTFAESFFPASLFDSNPNTRP